MLCHDIAFVYETQKKVINILQEKLNVDSVMYFWIVLQHNTKMKKTSQI